METHTIILHHAMDNIRTTVEADIDAENKEEALKKAAAMVEQFHNASGWTIHLPN